MMFEMISKEFLFFPLKRKNQKQLFVEIVAKKEVKQKFVWAWKQQKKRRTKFNMGMESRQ